MPTLKTDESLGDGVSFAFITDPFTRLVRDEMRESFNECLAFRCQSKTPPLFDEDPCPRQEILIL